MAERHGAVPEKAVLAAIDTLVRSDALATFTGTPERTEAPANLVHGAGAILQHVQPSHTIITPAEAARRGWIAAPTRRFELPGCEAADRLVPLLGRIGSLYAKGARSRVAVLDLGGLEVKGGGQLRTLLGGQAGDAGVGRELERLRLRA